MKIGKKISVMLLSVGLCMSLLVGCNSGGNKESNENNKKTTLSFYIPGYEDPIYKDAYDNGIKDFEKENPDIDIKVIPVSWDDSTTKMVSMIQGGNAPDVMITGSQRLKPLIKMKAIESLDSYISDDKKSQYIENLFNTANVDGKQYGLPMAFSSRALYYRKDLIKDPPKTWDDIVKISKEIESKNQDMKGYAVTGELKGSVDTQLGNFLVQNEASFYDENGKPSLNTPEALEAFEFYTGLYTKEKITPNPVDVNRNDLGDLFKNGQIAMFVNGPWAKDAMGIKEDDTNTPFGVAKLPAGKKKGEVLITDSYVISSNSKHKEEAYRFIDFMTQYKYQNAYDEKVGFFPLLKKEMDEKRYQTEFYKPFTEMINYGKPAPIPPVFEEFEDIIAKAVQKTALGEKTAKEAIQEAQTELTNLENK